MGWLAFGWVGNFEQIIVQWGCACFNGWHWSVPIGTQEIFACFSVSWCVAALIVTRNPPKKHTSFQFWVHRPIPILLPVGSLDICVANIGPLSRSDRHTYIAMALSGMVISGCPQLVIHDLQLTLGVCMVVIITEPTRPHSYHSISCTDMFIWPCLLSYGSPSFTFCWITNHSAVCDVKMVALCSTQQLWKTRLLGSGDFLFGWTVFLVIWLHL